MSLHLDFDEETLTDLAIRIAEHMPQHAHDALSKFIDRAAATENPREAS